MASNDITMSASAAMKHATLTVRITGVRVLRVRIWLACQLFKLAAVVAGCGLEFTGESR